jgi:hypothetical protein
MTLARHASPPPPTRITQARAAEQNHNAVRDARAARTVASHAADAEECWQLLAMLGLDADAARGGRTGLRGVADGNHVALSPVVG